MKWEDDHEWLVGKDLNGGPCLSEGTMFGWTEENHKNLSQDSI
jgi:hypothetical protein